MSSDNFSEPKSKMPSHIAYNVMEGKDDKNHWQKIGAAWPAKDDGLSLKLHSIPLSGEIALRSREALERMRAEREQQKQEHGQVQDEGNHQQGM